jgi:cell division protease FtsH
MSNPENTPSPRPEDPQVPGRKSGDRKERSNNNLFLYVVLGVLLVFVAATLISRQRRGDELKFSELFEGLESGRFTEKNVYDLTIGTTLITFQDQPRSKTSSLRSSEPATHYYHVNSFGMEEDKAELTKLLRAKKIEHTYSTPPMDVTNLVFVSAMLLTIVLFVMFVRRLGGAGSAMSFGRSRGKLYAQEDIDITFNDVAGIDEAVEELREVVEFLRTPAKYQALGGRIPRGVLLVGPPGTGKTLLAKAVAGEANVPFFSLSGSDFVEMFVGVGAARVRDMFQQATQKSPSIIFIDELDALGKVRGSGMPGGHDEREQTLNALLVEMDGFGTEHSVIVMAATNRPETLDPALLRPGRFDRNVLVDRPDIKGREAILKVHAAKIKMDASVDLSRVAKLSPGFVGADLANLVNEAALLAARANKNRVTMKEFDEGIERVIAGLEKQTRIIHQDEKLRVAYHECGHALVACSLPHTDPVHKISIIPRGMGALGYVLQRPEEERHIQTKSDLESRIGVLLGGITAEQIVYKETSTGAQNDLQRATDIARRMVTEFGMSAKLGRVHYSAESRSPFLSNATYSNEPQHSEQTMREIDLEVRRIIDEVARTTEEILVRRRDVLDHMARELKDCETMDSDRLKSILDQYRTTPQISPGTRSALPPESDPETPTVPGAGDLFPATEGA